MNAHPVKTPRTRTAPASPETHTCAAPAKALQVVPTSNPDTHSRPHREPLGPLWIINIAMAVLFGGMAIVMMFD
ncbi:MAG: hypothetical protein ABIT36_03145 [Steroidobacteraceae bacterium]